MNQGEQTNPFGEQIKSAWNDALETGNYEDLKGMVSDTVTSVLNEAEKLSSKAWQQKEEWRQKELREREERRQRESADCRDFAERDQRNREEWKRQQEQLRQRKEQQLQEAREYQELQRQQNQIVKQQEKNVTMLVKNKGMVSGILWIVFGSIANVVLFIITIVGMIFDWESAFLWLVFLIFTIVMICRGKKKIQLISKAKRYVQLCGVKMYAEIEDLASQVGLKPKEAEQELRTILQRGILPTAHMDKKGTHLMLNDVLYKQYMDAEDARKLREKEEREQRRLEKKRKEQEKNEKKQDGKAASEGKEAGKQTELEQMIAEGQEYIEKLHDLNDLIPGEVISEKLYRLESLLREIFCKVEQEPAQMGRMHKVMSYYLPTTVKLVEAYHDFDEVSSPNEEIVNTKKEIEATLDTINEAFVELLNSLFQDRIFDVTTDAQVLQTMLANEGLTKEMEIPSSTQ